jgi:hypothetical protein
MKRLVVIIMSAVMLFSFSVFAQRIQPRPTPKPQFMTVQDDASGNFLIFEMTTGEYKFVRCTDGLVLKGYGLVKEMVEGEYTFEHVQPDRKLTFVCYMGTHVGKGFVETFSRVTWRYDFEPVKEALFDSNMDDSVADCVKK